MLPRARVLVADDDPELLSAVSSALGRLGADVVRASSGAELIEHLADAGPFELVVTDISMPLLSGLQAMHSARSVGFEPAVIVMTALRDDRIGAEVASLGPKAILLRKPFDLDALEAAAERLIGVIPN